MPCHITGSESFRQAIWVALYRSICADPGHSAKCALSPVFGDLVRRKALDMCLGTLTLLMYVKRDTRPSMGLIVCVSQESRAGELGWS